MGRGEDKGIGRVIRGYVLLAALGAMLFAMVAAPFVQDFGWVIGLLAGAGLILLSCAIVICFTAALEMIDGRRPRG